MEGNGHDGDQGWQDNAAWDEGLGAGLDGVVVREGARKRPGSALLHRPEEILVDAEQYENPDDDGIRQVLDRVGADDRGDDVAGALGLRRLAVPGDVDLVDLVRSLREISPGSAALNAVLVADPQRYGGSAPPQPASRPKDIPGEASAGEGVSIAVLDTGFADPPPIQGVEAGPDDVDVLEEISPGQLGPAVGHGTFVAGIVKRHAPGARLLARRVLQTPFGVADELEVAKALLELERVDIINLSFGGFAVDDATMLTFERAVNQLPRTTLVVAAAGNHGVVRPHYSAAFKRVVAVGSAENPGDWRRAHYSNFGGWVDCSAAGTQVHSTFVEFRPFEGGAICSGTSFAAPQVSAAAAVLASRDGIPVRLAAHRLIHDDSRPVVDQGGAVVDPNHLP